MWACCWKTSIRSPDSPGMTGKGTLTGRSVVLSSPNPNADMWLGSRSMSVVQLRMPWLLSDIKLVGVDHWRRQRDINELASQLNTWPTPRPPNDMKARIPMDEQTITQIHGTPWELVRLSIAGALPASARPCKAREEVYMSLDAAEQAAVRSAALIILDSQPNQRRRKGSSKKAHFITDLEGLLTKARLWLLNHEEQARMVNLMRCECLCWDGDHRCALSSRSQMCLGYRTSRCERQPFEWPREEISWGSSLHLQWWRSESWVRTCDVSRIFEVWIIKPAVIAVISVPMQEKVAWMREDLMIDELNWQKFILYISFCHHSIDESHPASGFGVAWRKRGGKCVCTRNPRSDPSHPKFQEIGQMAPEFSNTGIRFYHDWDLPPNLFARFAISRSLKFPPYRACSLFFSHYTHLEQFQRWLTRPVEEIWWSDLGQKPWAVKIKIMIATHDSDDFDRCEPVDSVPFF